MIIKNTNDVVSHGVKIIVYGQAGAGKTSLIPTLPTPIILSAEAGLLSIQKSNLPYIEIKSMDDLKAAYLWLAKSDDAKAYESIAIDSISEIAEVVLVAEKKANKDGRAAYGEMGAIMTDLIRAFRDLPKNVLFSAKMEKSQDEMGRMLYSPSMPGNKIGQSLPYFFDEVFALRVEKDNEGKPQRLLQCKPCNQWQAKDRSTKLNDFEAPDLGAIIRKIGGHNGE